jgi:ankyrin repeat protein
MTITKRHLKFGGVVIASALAAMSLPAASPDIRLVDAVKNSDKAAIQALLPQHIDPNIPDLDGSTALHWASRWNNLETATALIRSGANVKAANRYGITPLSLACVNGSAPMVELLLKAGADPNTALPAGETVLMTAARTGDVDAVKALIAHGADVNFKETRRGQTALIWAAAEGNAEVAAELVERGADMHAKTKGGFTPLLFAVRDGRIGVVRALLKAGASANEKWEGGRTTGVNGISAMGLAVANAHYELASVLLDAGADPNAAAQGWTALHEITWVRKPGKGDNDPAPDGSGTMTSLEFVRKLAAHGANLNARMTKPGNPGGHSNRTLVNMIGATPFFMAAKSADAPMLRLLVELGADPLLPNADGTAPLLVAAGVGTLFAGEDPGTEKEVIDALKVCLEFGADINSVDNKGETAVHGAAYKQAPLVAKFLAENGAKIEVWNQKNKTGWTPLRIAEGVIIGTNLKQSPATADALREVMAAAGVSTVVEADIERVGHNGK